MSIGFEEPLDPFYRRHLGSDPEEIRQMLEALGFATESELLARVIPDSIRQRKDLALGPPGEEGEKLAELREMASRNEVWRSYLGLGYHGTRMPPVIRRNVLENPGWYTQYTPYQAEISQGRLEALMNFQTLVVELTGLPLANASLLDEATAAAEAMAMCRALAPASRRTFLAAPDCHPQTLEVVRTRARALGVELEVAIPDGRAIGALEPFGVLIQSPSTDGRLSDYSELAKEVHEAGSRLVVATDLLALTLFRPPGELDADIAVGSTQRFGLPLAYGGPHAAFLSAREEFERVLPGRIAGVSRDASGRPAFRLARQTREQHIRRERATSNICTAQVLPAVLASMYAVYHGPDGLRGIARRVHDSTRRLAAGLKEMGVEMGDGAYFDTLRIELGRKAAERTLAAAAKRRINLRDYESGTLGVALDETVRAADLRDLVAVFAEGLERPAPKLESLGEKVDEAAASGLERQSEFLTQEVFRRFHSEHEMLRYLFQLQERDLSLVHSMIPLGSCTMKLNATAEMMPVTWPEFSDLHPFAPVEQAQGYRELFTQLESWLAEITGFDAVSLQPNAGSQGELTGLLVIRAYLESLGRGERDVCLIPTSAHGTNPASAVMAGMRVVAIECDDDGSIDLADLEAKSAAHGERLAALMITYPSTHGVFETEIRRVCEIVHRHGGQVYLDGANMNAQVGLCRPGSFGADVCHLNLHKTFCIPHGGGGPGMGPICVARHLAPFLPGHPLNPVGGEQAIGPVSAAPYGSAGILPISWMYIAMMGAEGLTRASSLAVLNANYMARRLAPHYPVLYTGTDGLVAHEFILDLRSFRKSAGVTVDDVAKRLMDYGFHAPTMSWPVAGTMMVEPTESESKTELDRFCDAMISIRAEIREIEEGRADRGDNPLVNAPHTLHQVTADRWTHPYGREQAAFPDSRSRERKFWPASARIDNAWGDRNLTCTCDPVSVYAEEAAAASAAGR